MDFQKMAAYRNQENRFAQKLGITVEEIGPGYARTVKTMLPDDVNPVQIPHGGCYFSLADTACGSAAISGGFLAVTLSADYHFYRSAKVGDVVTAEAHVTKNGKTVCVCAVEVKNQDGLALGGGTFTFFILDQKLPEELSADTPEGAKA